MSDLYDRAATPRMTHHAKQRCFEMKLNPALPKQIIMGADLVVSTPSRGWENPRFVATSAEHPEYAVPFFVSPDDKAPVVLTVLFASDEQYDRQGATYKTKEPA